MKINRSQLRKIILKEINLLKEESEGRRVKNEIESFINAHLGSDFLGEEPRVENVENFYEEIKAGKRGAGPGLIVDPPLEGELVRIFSDLQSTDVPRAAKSMFERLAKLLQKNLPAYKYTVTVSEMDGGPIIHVFNR